MKCKNCVRHVHLNDDGERTPGTPNWCFYLNDSPDEEIERDCAAFKPITNYDRIISKTPEELARYMTEVQMYVWCPNDDAMDCRNNCAMCWLDWLRQEVEE